MPLTLLSDYTGYEASLVPKGANLKKRFLVVKENGDTCMKSLLEKILKADLKDEDKVDEVAKNLDLGEEEVKVLKAVMRMVGSDDSPLNKANLMKALESLGGKEVKKEGDEKTPEEIKKAEEDEAAAAAAKKKAETEAVDKEGKGGGDMPKIPVMKEDGSFDLSGVDEALRPSLEVVCKQVQASNTALAAQTAKNITLADELKAERDARVLKEYEAKANALGHEGEEGKKIARVLKSAYEVSKENGETTEAVLKSAHEKVEKASVFEELGTGGSNQTRHGQGAWEKIEKAADDIIKDSDKSITKTAAIDLVLKQHPELYKEYEAEKRKGVA